ncbi:MAG TPA: hypothetical protein PLH07_09540 [Sulfurovum sp.]|jgi:hypothetical protein|nr:MAG: hypothetical protein B7Y23_09615 [Sulfurovum sp. 16-42-52]OYZ48063.1 MAG: hypothetical protein B7Y13_08795 [Sulfurovum sp. 24-42-9]OZA43821.1 MAG: hypothetical protein B7X80_08645 [Sulfurovum sp. 17-42-90]OZA61146.1 MAG: hypothetical protein B7X69_01315 [Sulfurovum sp. 39-42-12]HQR74299.1 hypothetical protein [Sulfurovum sp.]
MRQKIIFMALCALFFSAFHDSLMPLLQTQEHQSVVHCQSDSTMLSDTHGCNKCSQIHSMLHFIAIVDLDETTGVRFMKQAPSIHTLQPHMSPVQQSSYKPPIA